MTIAIGEDHKLMCQEAVGVIDIPLLTITDENIKPYGFLVTDFANVEVEIVTWPAAGRRPIDPGTGRDGGITEGDFEIYRHGHAMYAENHAVDGHYVTGWFHDPRLGKYDGQQFDFNHIYVREANYHPDGGQVFFSRHGAPFVLLLALAGDDVKPQDFKAFYCDGSVGVHIYANIWHQPPFTIHERMVFDDKQGKVHACVSFDSVDEFGVYMRVPLVNLS